MNEIDHYLDSFFNRGLIQLQHRQESAFAQVKEGMKQLNESIIEGNEGMAIAEWESEWKTPSKTTVPSLLKYGDLILQIGKKEDLRIPFLLPTSVNAVLFDAGDDAERIPVLFQNIILRMLMTMKLNLVKVSIVDKDFGNSFDYVVKRITNPILKKEVIYKDEDITRLISHLAEEVVEANRDFMGQFADINVYNAQAERMAHPYHFVFIDDFPKGFTSQTIDDLLNLIDRGNALKAGIKIFINYSAKNTTPYGFDLSRFKSICASITLENKELKLHNWSLQLPPNVTPVLEMDLPIIVEEIKDYIKGIMIKEEKRTLDSWIEDLKISNNVWSGNTTNGISIPVGFVGPTNYFVFKLACNNKDISALITGQTRSGKSWFLKNIIVNAAMKYSPEELCFYLADFSQDGTTFSIFKKLPHVRALMMANNKDYVVRMFQDLSREIENRSRLFQEVQDYQEAQDGIGVEVEKLSDYRELTGETMPRIVFIIDEFQDLLNEDGTDETTIKAREILKEAIRQWGKYGVSLILSTQTLSGVRIAPDVEENITYRVALMEDETVSHRTIGNKAAACLTEPGQAIMNNAHGDISKNVYFQVAGIDSQMPHIKYLSEKYKVLKGDYKIPFVCEKGVDANIADNHTLVNLLKETRENNQFCDVYIGKHELLRLEHTRIMYARQPNSNTLIIGNDFKSLVLNIMVQLIQLRQQSRPNSRFYIVDCFNYGDRLYKGALDTMANLSDSFIVRHSDTIEEVITEVSEELLRRKDAQRQKKSVEERVILAILNAQNCDALKPVHDLYTKPSKSAELLSAILAEGSPLGIHSIVHAFSFASLFKSSGIFDNKDLEHFANRIALKGADMVNMYLGNTQLSKIRMNVAGRVLVDNCELDGETYEQCYVYSRISVKEQSPLSEFIANMFNRYRDVR